MLFFLLLIHIFLLIDFNNALPCGSFRITTQYSSVKKGRLSFSHPKTEPYKHLKEHLLVSVKTLFNRLKQGLSIKFPLTVIKRMRLANAGSQGMNGYLPISTISGEAS